MADRYGISATIGGHTTSNKFKVLIEYLKSFDDYQIYCGCLDVTDGESSVTDYERLLTECQEAGLSIRLCVEGDHGYPPEVHVWHPGMSAPDRTNATDAPAISIKELRTAARENKTINMVIAQFEVFERAIHALAVDGKPPRL